MSSLFSGPPPYTQATSSTSDQTATENWAWYPDPAARVISKDVVFLVRILSVISHI